jgi:lipid-binding SYLF domain-containing protein
MRIEGGSVGFQIGGSSTDVILLVMSGRGVDKLLGSKFTVGADAAVAAGPIGRQASAQTDATMHAEMLAWSRSRGAFAGVSLQGSTLRTDGSENQELYGKDLSARDIVRGTVAAPAAAKELMAALGKY